MQSFMVVSHFKREKRESWDPKKYEYDMYEATAHVAASLTCFYLSFQVKCSQGSLYLKCKQCRTCYNCVLVLWLPSRTGIQLLASMIILCVPGISFKKQQSECLISMYRKKQMYPKRRRKKFSITSSVICRGIMFLHARSSHVQFLKYSIKGSHGAGNSLCLRVASYTILCWVDQRSHLI